MNEQGPNEGINEQRTAFVVPCLAVHWTDKLLRHASDLLHGEQGGLFVSLPSAGFYGAKINRVAVNLSEPFSV